MPVTIQLQNDTVDKSITAIHNIITHIATGDDNTIPLVSNTNLGNETDRELIDNKSKTAIELNSDILQDITQNNGNDIKEIGVFDDAISGTMYIHSLTSVITKDANTEAFIKSLLNIIVQSL